MYIYIYILYVCDTFLCLIQSNAIKVASIQWIKSSFRVQVSLHQLSPHLPNVAGIVEWKSATLSFPGLYDSKTSGVQQENREFGESHLRFCCLLFFLLSGKRCEKTLDFRGFRRWVPCASFVSEYNDHSVWSKQSCLVFCIYLYILSLNSISNESIHYN